MMPDALKPTFNYFLAVSEKAPIEAIIHLLYIQTITQYVVNLPNDDAVTFLEHHIRALEAAIEDEKNE